MKYTDDYQVKLKIWAADPTVYPLPTPPALPRFGFKKFRTHIEMNEWMRQLLAEIARAGGCTWTSYSND